MDLLIDGGRDVEMSDEQKLIGFVTVVRAAGIHPKLQDPQSVP